MKYSQEQIISTIKKLGLEHSNIINAKGWLRCKCGNPLHDDKHMSNCAVNVESYIMNCKACGYKKSLNKVVQDNLKCDEALADIFITKNILIETGSIFLSCKKPITRINKIKPKEISLKNLILTDFDPKDYYYTRIRGFNKDFLNKHNIKFCLSKPYIDHMIIPIIDKSKNINTFEARKIMKFEYYKKFFPKNSEIEFSYSDYEKIFKTLLEMEKWQIQEGKIIDKQGNYRTEIALFYLLLPKVLYPSNSNVQETIFNIDNLDFNEDLWFSEGTGSLAKLSGITNNYSCIFGTSITESQIEYLKKFKKRLIFIYDRDEAALKLLKIFEENKLNVWIPNIKSNDESRSFLRELSTCRLIPLDLFLNRV